MQDSKFGNGYKPQYRKPITPPKGYKVSFNRHQKAWSLKDPEGRTWMMPKGLTRTKTVEACFEHKRQREQANKVASAE